MSNEITMPKLSDTMEEGKILRWLKRPGDPVHRGDALAEVETDKADMVMEAFDDGVLETLLVKEGESAPVGAVIALLSSEGAAASAAAPAAEPAVAEAATAASTARPAASARPAEPVAERPKLMRPRPQSARAAIAARRGGGTPSPPAGAAREHRDNDRTAADGDAGASRSPAASGSDLEANPVMSANPSAAPTAIARPPLNAATSAPRPAPADAEAAADGHSRLRASPLARRVAEEAGIDLASIRGTGPEGRVTKRDVDDFLREQQLFKFRRLVSPREGAPGTREELSRMRKTIASRMALSKREIPHFYATVEVDMEEAVKLKNSLEATELFDEPISYNDIIIKATALALARYPRMNSSYQDDAIFIHPTINIGVAVAVEDGLIVPVIGGCERLSLPETARAAHKLIAKAARGGFTAEELSGATFTISNMGMLGLEHFSAVIVPPQAAILAVSAIKARPVVRNGALAAGTTMMVTVSCDHRIIDGVVGARFLQELKRFLENPASLLV